MDINVMPVQPIIDSNTGTARRFDANKKGQGNLFAAILEEMTVDANARQRQDGFAQSKPQTPKEERDERVRDLRQEIEKANMAILASLFQRRK